MNWKHHHQISYTTPSWRWCYTPNSTHQHGKETNVIPCNWTIEWTIDRTNLTRITFILWMELNLCYIIFQWYLAHCFSCKTRYAHTPIPMHTSIYTKGIPKPSDQRQYEENNTGLGVLIFMCVMRFCDKGSGFITTTDIKIINYIWNVSQLDSLSSKSFVACKLQCTLTESQRVRACRIL